MSDPAVRLQKFGKMAAVVSAFGALCWILASARILLSADYAGEALDTDFSAYWAAAKLVLADGPLAPFDVDRLNDARGLTGNHKTTPMLWLYPPAWMLVILPFGMIPYFYGWLIFVFASLTAFGAAIWKPARDVPGAWFFLMAAPAVLVTFIIGQNSMITAALLAVAIEAIRSRRLMLAGLAIAAMTMKPQLGLAIPIVLLAGRHWIVIAWATVGAVLILASSVVWPGLDYWPAFIAAMEDASARMSVTDLPKVMASSYGSAFALGVPHEVALRIQLGVAILVAAGLAWLWYSPARFDLKAAGLVFGVLLMTPYAFHYELVFAPLGCLYLARAGSLSTRPRAGLALFIWLMPLLGFALGPSPGFFLCAPALLTAFAVTLADARRDSADAVPALVARS